MNVRALVFHPDGAPGHGCVREVALEVVEVSDATLVLPELVVVDVRGGTWLDRRKGDLRFDPAGGGGPFAPAEERRDARAFGIVNVAYQLRRGLNYLATLLEWSIPPLAVRIGVHADVRPGWGGGHYRLPARTYTSLPEAEMPAATGEIHLGAGGSFGRGGGGRYFVTPAHNAAIVAHELGHHLTRHTADFRLNARRPPLAQTNHRIPLDEGTADYVAAILLRTPDIYGWHRAAIPSTEQRRRRLDGPWTMAAFRGGHEADPHLDGTVWSSALWSARTAVATAGGRHEDFDQLVVEAMVRIGASDRDEPMGEALRRRRSFGQAVSAILEADRARGRCFSGVIASTFAERGIETGFSNADLRDRSRGLSRSFSAEATR